MRRRLGLFRAPQETGLLLLTSASCGQRTCCFSKFSIMTAVNRLSITMLTSSTNETKKGIATQLPQLPAAWSQ